MSPAHGSSTVDEVTTLMSKRLIGHVREGSREDPREEAATELRQKNMSEFA